MNRDTRMSTPAARGYIGDRTDEEKRALILTDDRLTDAATWNKAYAAVEASGLGQRLLNMTTKSRGRKPSGLTIIDVLAGMLAVCLTNGSPNFSRIAEALHSEMPGSMRVARGISRRWPSADTTGRERRRQEATAREAVRRRFFALVEQVDSYRGLRHENLDLPEFVDIARKHVAEDPTGDQDAQVRHALLTVMNDILHGALDFVPDSMLSQLGDAVAVDGTFVPTFARAGLNHKSFRKVVGAVRENGDPENADVLTAENRDLVAKRLGGNRLSRISSDPEAGHYIRGPQNASEYKGFGFEAHLCISRDSASELGQVRFPTLTMGIAIDAPSYDPGPKCDCRHQPLQEMGRPPRVGPNRWSVRRALPKPAP